MSTPSDLAESAKCYCFDDATERSIIVYLLVNGATNMTPSDLAIAAKSYSYDLDTWKKVVVYLLDANGADTPNALAEASKCYCFDNGAFKRIVAYLLSKGGGSGTCPQDMQVAWTPTNVKLGELTSFVIEGASGVVDSPATFVFNGTTSLGGFAITNQTNLVSASFPNLVSIDPAFNANFPVFLFRNNPSLVSVSFPVLVTLSNSANMGGFSCTGNPSMTTFSLPVWVPDNGFVINLSGNALNALSVNLVLARCVANAGYVTGNIDLTGGTNAAPSGQGIADKATLIGRGVTVLTN